MPLGILIIAAGKIAFRAFYLNHPRAGVSQPASRIGCCHRLFQRNHQQPLKIIRTGDRAHTTLLVLCLPAIFGMRLYANDSKSCLIRSARLITGMSIMAPSSLTAE